MNELDPRAARMRLMLWFAAAMFVLVVGGIVLVWNFR